RCRYVGDDKIYNDQAQRREEHHAHTKRNRYGNVINQYKNQSNCCPVSVRVAFSKNSLNTCARIQPHKTNKAKKNQWNNYQLISLLGGFLLAFAYLPKSSFIFSLRGSVYV